MILDDARQRWVHTDLRASDFEGGVENTQRGETRRVGMGAVIGVEDVDEDAEELDNGWEAVLNSY